MYKKLFIFPLIALVFCVKAQVLHNPSDIQRIMEKSQKSYILDSTLIDVRIPNYVTISINIPDIPPNFSSNKAAKYHKKAVQAQQKKNYKKAIHYYKKLIAIDSVSIQWQRALADIYWETNSYAEGLASFIKLSEAYPHDALWYHKLSHAYRQNQQFPKAIYYSVLAHLYNRNDLILQANMENMLALDNHIYQAWRLFPIYEISATADSTKINIQYDKNPWAAYAACKAVWQYEPNYKINMQLLSDNTLDVIEEKECLYNALINYVQNNEENAYPELDALANALELQLVSPYVWYEKLLKEKPELIFTLTPSELEDLVRYIKLIRCEQVLFDKRE